MSSSFPGIEAAVARVSAISNVLAKALVSVFKKLDISDQMGIGFSTGVDPPEGQVLSEHTDEATRLQSYTYESQEWVGMHLKPVFWHMPVASEQRCHLRHCCRDGGW